MSGALPWATQLAVALGSFAAMALVVGVWLVWARRDRPECWTSALMGKGPTGDPARDVGALVEQVPERLKALRVQQALTQVGTLTPVAHQEATAAVLLAHGATAMGRVPSPYAPDHPFRRVEADAVVSPMHSHALFRPLLLNLLLRHGGQLFEGFDEQSPFHRFLKGLSRHPGGLGAHPLIIEQLLPVIIERLLHEPMPSDYREACQAQLLDTLQAVEGHFEKPAVVAQALDAGVSPSAHEPRNPYPFRQRLPWLPESASEWHRTQTLEALARAEARESAQALEQTLAETPVAPVVRRARL